MSPMTQEEKEYLKDLDKRIWKRSVDSFGHIHSFPSGELSGDDKEKVFAIVLKRFPCVLHSGIYGNLSFSVFDHSEFPGVPPELIASFSSEHFGVRQTFAEWKKEFDFMSEFTHSDENRKMCAFYKLPEPATSSKYEY